MTRRLWGGLRREAVRGIQAVKFFGYYSHQFFLSTLAVAWEILTPRSRIAPAIVELPLRGRTALEITSVAHLISLTPGTLVLEVRSDPPSLLIHGMYATDSGIFRAQLNDLKNRLLAVLRPAEGGTTW